MLAEEQKQRVADSKAFAAELESLASRDTSAWPSSLRAHFQQHAKSAADVSNKVPTRFSCVISFKNGEKPSSNVARHTRRLHSHQFLRNGKVYVYILHSSADRQDN